MSGDARAQAARVLHAVIGAREPLDLALPVADARLPDPRDRALLRAIVRAALRHRFRYAAALTTLLNKPLPREQGLVHELLMVGLAQLDQGITPPYAAVDATVAAARVLKRPQFAGLVNAVLRRAPAALTEVAARDDAQIRFEHPRWLLERLQHDWPEHWPEIVAANNAMAPTWLRVHTPRARREQLQGWLAAHDFATTTYPPLTDALLLAESAPILSLPGYAEGAFAVQDGAAQYAVDVLDARPGQRVLDACAAPGGKTAHIAARTQGIELLALEVNPARIPRLNANLARMGVVCDVRCADAAAPETWWDGRHFDRILIDAPCSGTGVMRRHPDIRWLRRPQDVIAAIELQSRLLDALWPLLAPGGRLVYATCSVLSDENAHQLAAFLWRTPNACARDAVPHAFGIESGAGRQNLPGREGMDGFFYAVLEHAGA